MDIRIALTADIADEMHANRPFPSRQALASGRNSFRWDHRRAVAWLSEVRQFWLDAAQGYTDLATKGCPESIQDAQDALAKAEAVSPHKRPQPIR